MKFLKYLAVVALAVCALVSSAKAQQMNPVVQDNFHRGNESPLADYGNWSPYAALSANYPVVVSDTLRASTTNITNGALWTGILWGPDQYASMIIGANSGGTDLLFLRADPNSNSAYRLQVLGPINGGSASFIMYKIINGTYTQLSSWNTPLNVNQPVYFTVQGTTLTVIVNGVVVKSVTDRYIATGVPGIGLNPLGNLSGNIIVQFSAGTMTSTNAGVPCGASGYGMYSTPVVQFTGDAGVNQVSASGGNVTFYVGATGKTPVVGQSFNISNVVVGGASDLNGFYTISSVGTPVGGWTPVTASTIGGANLNIPLTTLSTIGLFDEHIQFPTAIALSGNYVTVTVPNNFAPNQSVVIRDALNSLYNVRATIYSASPTAFTYYFNHSNVASENETNGATVSGTDFIAEFVTVEGQATGNLSCVTSNFQNEITINSTRQKGPQYTPGNHGTYTAQVDIAGPCDGTDPLDPCGGDMGGGVACLDSGTCGGGDNFAGNDCPGLQSELCLPVFQDEIAYTRYKIPQNEAPLETWTTDAFLFNYTWGLFLDFSDCSTPTTPPDLFFPATPWPFKVDGIPIPLQPPVSFFHVGYCHRFATTGPWTCWPFTQMSYPVGNAQNIFTAKCTKHP